MRQQYQRPYAKLLAVYFQSWFDHAALAQRQSPFVFSHSTLPNVSSICHQSTSFQTNVDLHYSQDIP